MNSALLTIPQAVIGDEGQRRYEAVLDAIVKALLDRKRTGQADPAQALMGCENFSDIQHIARTVSPPKLMDEALKRLYDISKQDWGLIQGWLFIPGNARELLQRVIAVRQRVLEATPESIAALRHRQGVAA